LAKVTLTTRALAAIGALFLLFTGVGVLGCTNAKAEKIDPNYSTTFPLDRFIVNLSDPKAKRYLKAKIALEITKEVYKTELTARLPQLRDTILLHLSSKNMNDIGTVKGKTRLRRELVAKINRVLKTGKIRNIYFTQFVIQ
jgi:flagellar FliL protein